MEQGYPMRAWACVCVAVGRGGSGETVGYRPWLTLKAPGCIPELRSRFWRTSRTSRLVGSAGRAPSWFSGRIRSCSSGSSRRASSSMEEIELLERLIRFSFAVGHGEEHRETRDLPSFLALAGPTWTPLHPF